jgi:hypothetical protein
METKEKKVLNIRYRDSGVKTLSGTGVIMFVAAALCLLLGVFMLTSDNGDVTSIAVYLLASFFPLLFFWGGMHRVIVYCKNGPVSKAGS